MVTSLAAVVCSTAALVALARDARLEAQRMSATHEGTQRRTQLSRYHFIFVDAAAGKLTRRLCQNFYEAACQVIRQFETLTSQSGTRPVRPRRRSTSHGTGTSEFKDRTSSSASHLARRGGSPFYARSVLKALIGAGAGNDSREERRCLCHGVHVQPGSDARSLLQLDGLSVHVYAAGFAAAVSRPADRMRSG